MTEGQQFFDVLKALKLDDLISMVDDTPLEREFIGRTLAAETFDLEKLGATVGRTAEMRRGEIVVESMHGNRPGIWQRAKYEMDLLLCTNAKKYSYLRENISEGADYYKPEMVVSSIAAAVGRQIGVTQGVLIPIVALILAFVAKISKEAYCGQSRID